MQYIGMRLFGRDSGLDLVSMQMMFHCFVNIFSLLTQTGLFCESINCFPCWSNNFFCKHNRDEDTCSLLWLIYSCVFSPFLLPGNHSGVVLSINARELHSYLTS